MSPVENNIAVSALDGSGQEEAPVALTLVRPVVNALNILRYLSRTAEPATVTHIAQALEINTSTCFNILRTLASEGAVTFNERSKSYALGLGVVQLAQSALSEGGKTEILRPLLLRLADTYSVTVTLWRLADEKRNVLISTVQHSSALQIQMQVGQRVPLYIGAFGRILAAYHRIPKSDLLALFASMRWGNAPSFNEYWEDVQLVGERGWAVDDGHFARGVCSVAVPVMNQSNELHMGVVATMFQGQLDAAQMAALTSELTELSLKIRGLF